MKKSCPPVLALLMSFVFLWLSQAVSAAPQEPTPKGASTEVLAQIGQTVITKAEIDALIETFPPDFKAKLDASADQKREFLDGYVQGNLLAMEAKAQNVDKKKAIQTRIEYAKMGLLAQEYVKDVIAKVPKTTDGDIKKYFESHKAQYTIPHMVAGKHIMVRVDPAAKPEEQKAALAKIEGIKRNSMVGQILRKWRKNIPMTPDQNPKAAILASFQRIK